MVAAFLDLTKAFPSGSHQKLLQKLSDTCVAGTALRAFAAYLYDRKQRVVLDGDVSEYETGVSGVPEGSVLGPLFYTMFVNPFLRKESQCKFESFADDIICYATGKTRAEAVEKVQKGMTKAAEWFKSNLLKLNMDKTIVMCFATNAKKGSGTELVKVEGIILPEDVSSLLRCHARQQAPMG